MFMCSYCCCLYIPIVIFMYSYCYVYVLLLLCLCIFIVMFMYSYCRVYISLLLCLCILIVMFIYSYYYVYVFLLLRMFRSVYSVSMCCFVYCLCVNVYCTVLLPPGVNPIAVNKYIISSQINIAISEKHKGISSTVPQAGQKKQHVHLSVKYTN